MGWYAMALVDTLDHFPQKHPQRPLLIGILNRLARSVAKYQDQRSGLWYQVLDKAGAKGNYLESSAACMFVYALAKGVRGGYLHTGYMKSRTMVIKASKESLLSTTQAVISISQARSVSPDSAATRTATAVTSTISARRS